MIKEYEYLHGIIFSRLCSNTSITFTIKPYGKGYSSYVINSSAGLYIKYSSRKRSPWRFTFLKSHINKISRMHRAFGEVFIVLVCYLDGVATIKFSDLKPILNSRTKHRQVSIHRKRNTMYRVTSPKGELSEKISKTSCPDKIIDYLNDL